MKRNKNILHIENPCQENWEEMETQASGKFCSHCLQSVIDFTNLDDGEILKIIGSNKSKMCGRFEDSQLNRLLIKPKKKTTTTKLYKIAASLLLLSSQNNFGSTKNYSDMVMQLPLRKEGDASEARSEENNSLKRDSLKNIAVGEILDSHTEKGVSNAKVFIKGTSLSVSTNVDGKFEIIVPDSLIKRKIHFEVVSSGYEIGKFAINKSQLSMTNNGKIKRKILLKIKPSVRQIYGSVRILD